MASNDPSERRMIATEAALKRWAAEDPVEGTRAAREGLLRKFYKQTDPTLTEPERWKRAERLRKAWLLKMSRKASKAARARKAARSRRGAA